MDDPCKGINKCWICGELFSDGEGFDVADNGEETVCLPCWHTIDGYHRYLLGFVTRAQDQGGLGIQELFRVSISTSLLGLHRHGRN